MAALCRPTHCRGDWLLTGQGEIDVGRDRAGPLSLGWRTGRIFLSAVGGSDHFRLLAAVLITVLAMLCLAVGVAIFTDFRGWAKWCVGVLWASNSFIAVQLALVYAASKSRPQRR
jgi:hypothetical protein